jgi:peroxiredoxin Q/BCP
MLESGQTAPGFDVATHLGQRSKRSDFEGRHLVIFFYPKADTPACTEEAKAFSDALGQFAARNAQVLGVSRDEVKKNAKFAEKTGLKVPLGCDPEGVMCQAYGVWVEKSMYGKKYMGIERTTFLIDPDGIIKRIWNKVKVPGHVDEVLGALG